MEPKKQQNEEISIELGKIITAKKAATIIVAEHDEVERLAVWFGDPQKDVLTAVDWIASVQRAKIQYGWDDEVTMNNVVKVGTTEL
jgi:hypothetical protein